MNDVYAFFAHYYDRFMEEAPYDAWMDWIMETLEPLKRHVGDQLTILDLGCGTGNLAVPLLLQGHRVVGTDLSAPMVQLAQEKAERLPGGLAKRAIWDVQAMHEPLSARVHSWLAPTNRVDAVICCCDSINYVTDPEQVKQTFARVRDVLERGGLFLLDMHSMQQINNYEQEQPYIWNESDVAYIWTCVRESQEQIAHELSLFVQQADGHFTKIEEVHHQRAYSIEWMRQSLREAHLELVQVTADFSPFAPSDSSRRIFLVAVAV